MRVTARILLRRQGALLALDVLGRVEGELGLDQRDVRDQEAQQRLGEDAAVVVDDRLARGRNDQRLKRDRVSARFISTLPRRT
jgi:hypothetical protein